LERGKEIVFQQVGLDKKMLAVVEHLLEVEQVVVIGVTVGLDIAQQFQLVQGLVKEVLVILDDLETCQLVVL
jgi:hypothetical protein